MYATQNMMNLQAGHSFVLLMAGMEGHRNGDITTHDSAPELEELLDAADRVCEEP